MINWLDKLGNRRTPFQVTILSLLVIGLIGVLDYFTGYELSFSIFYLVPILFATWYGREWAAYAMCVISAIVWLLVDYFSGNTYSHWIIPVWNAFVRLAFFLIVTNLQSKLRTRLGYEEALARTDQLTQVLNAHAFKETAYRLLQLARRHHHSAVLGYIDLDDFKAINDSLGHSEGDLVLKAVSGILRQGLRGTDVVGRLGGDEFAVFMPEIGYLDARAAFDRIHEKLLQEASAENWPIGISIGVAVFPRAPADIDEAIRVADHLMYRVKGSGKNKVFYEELVIADEKSIDVT